MPGDLVDYMREEEERRRLIEERGLAPAAADARLAAQPRDDNRRARVNEIIDNSHTLKTTRALVEAAWWRFCQILVND